MRSGRVWNRTTRLSARSSHKGASCMSAPAELLGWVARAEEDFILARSALRRKKPLLYGATFHAQQCVEKYLKALLVAQELVFPRTHDLVALSDLCLQGGITIPVAQDALDR